MPASDAPPATAHRPPAACLPPDGNSSSQICGFPGLRVLKERGTAFQRPWTARVALNLCNVGLYDIRIYHREDLKDQVGGVVGALGGGARAHWRRNLIAQACMGSQLREGGRPPAAAWALARADHYVPYPPPPAVPPAMSAGHREADGRLRVQRQAWPHLGGPHAGRVLARPVGHNRREPGRAEAAGELGGCCCCRPPPTPPSCCWPLTGPSPPRCEQAASWCSLIRS